MPASFNPRGLEAPACMANGAQAASLHFNPLGNMSQEAQPRTPVLSRVFLPEPLDLGNRLRDLLLEHHERAVGDAPRVGHGLQRLRSKPRIIWRVQKPQIGIVHDKLELVRELSLQDDAPVPRVDDLEVLLDELDGVSPLVDEVALRGAPTQRLASERARARKPVGDDGAVEVGRRSRTTPP